jgi:chorismate synthase
MALGVPAGLGEPVFDKLDADLAKAVMSVGAVKGVEIGAGFDVAARLGSENNDPFVIEGGKIRTATNNSGGIQGGISNGMPIVLRAAVKPTPSILKPQGTVDMERQEETEIRIEGRHDPCIVPRIVPVLEAMVALVLADHAVRAGFTGPAKL